MPNEPKTLTDGDELLYRQVNPGFIRDGRVSSQAFRPTPKDAGLLSADRETLSTPELSFQLFTTGLGLPSAGTWALTVQECGTQGLPVLENPLQSPPEPVANAAHVVVSFKDVGSKSQVEAKGQKLARFAQARGRLFPAPDTKQA